MMTDLIKYYVDDHVERKVNLMCAGGVFGNVKVTQKLKEIPQIKACFVQPQMGDGGLCLGASALAYEENLTLENKKSRKTIEMKSMYLAVHHSEKNSDYSKNSLKNWIILKHHQSSQNH